MNKKEAKLIADAYKKGYIDGSIEVINNTCEFCHSYPMTANCNNAGCDRRDDSAILEEGYTGAQEH